MSALAIAEPNAAAPAPQPAKRVRIPKRISQAIDLIANGTVRYQKDAAERVGLTPEHLSRMLAKPHVRGVMRERASENLARATLRSSARLVELIDASSEHVAAKVSERILESEGLLRSNSTQHTVNVGVSVGYVVKLKHVSADSACAGNTPQVIDNAESEPQR